MISFNEYINDTIIHDLSQESMIRGQRDRINRLTKENWELRREVRSLRELIGAEYPKILEEFERIAVRSESVNRIEESNIKI